MDILLWALVASIAINLIMFVPAFFLKTDKLTDISYSLTFIFVILYAYSRSVMAPSQYILLLLVLIWALRLGTFLFIRINKTGKDSRFDEMRNKLWSFIRFWFFQGLTVFVVLLATLLFMEQKITDANWLSAVGVAIFIIGLALESSADWQKFQFKNKGLNKTWIDSGVWRISRHPNYLGEIMIWAGIYLFCFSSLGNTSRLLALVSPLYIATILLFFSGVPLLEKSADKKWGKDKAYQDYKKEVPSLLPSPKSISRIFKP